ncbi:MAG: hypothetical protein AAGJ10_11450 [Bacteroidota bacterium]
MASATAHDHPHRIGRLKFFDAKKGFGFVEAVGTGIDHYTNTEYVSTPPSDGELVLFLPDAPKKAGGNPLAKQVEPLRTAPHAAEAWRMAAETHPPDTLREVGYGLGTVTSFRDDGGYGFLAVKGGPPHGGTEVFFHRTSLVNPKVVPPLNCEVVFVLVPSKKKKGHVEARQVMPLTAFEGPTALLSHHLGHLPQRLRHTLLQRARSGTDLAATYAVACPTAPAPTSASALELAEEALKEAHRTHSDDDRAIFEAHLMEQGLFDEHPTWYTGGFLAGWIRTYCAEPLQAALRLDPKRLPDVAAHPHVTDAELLALVTDPDVPLIDKATLTKLLHHDRLPATQAAILVHRITQRATCPQTVAAHALQHAEQHLDEPHLKTVRDAALASITPEVHLTLFGSGLLPPPEHIADEAIWPLPVDALERFLQSTLAPPEQHAHILSTHLDRLPPRHDDTPTLFALIQAHAPTEGEAFQRRWANRLDGEDRAAFLRTYDAALLDDPTATLTPQAHLDLFEEGRLSSYPPAILTGDLWPLEPHLLEQVLAHPSTASSMREALLEGHLPFWPADVGHTHQMLVALGEWLPAEAAHHLGRLWMQRLSPTTLASYIQRHGLDLLAPEWVAPLLHHTEDHFAEVTLPPSVMWRAITTYPPLETLDQRDHLLRLLDRLPPSGFTPVALAVDADEATPPNPMAAVHACRWLETDAPATPWAQVLPGIVYLPTSRQVKALRKAFHLHEQGQWVFTIEQAQHLLNEPYVAVANTPFLISFEVRLAIAALRIVEDAADRRLKDTDLLKTVYDHAEYDPNLSQVNLKDRKGVAEGLFHHCPGRAYIDLRDPKGRIVPWPKDHNGPAPELAIVIDLVEYLGRSRRGGYSDVRSLKDDDRWTKLLNAIKDLPGRRYLKDEKKWVVPRSSVPALRAFAQEFDYAFEVPKGQFARYNPHLVEFERKNAPSHVTYCEGRKALTLDRRSNRPFWWCGNQPCMSNAVPEVMTEDWTQYTVLDMLRIAGAPLNEYSKKYNESIPLGLYFRFIGMLNRILQLLPKLRCASCEALLYPTNSSDFAYYRVTQFHCIHTACQNDETIYIHHCFNKKCNDLIDSRESKQCPNGWYICSNDACGCCCSDEVLKRRAGNLATVRGFSSSRALPKGHLELDEWYCYRCGDRKPGGATKNQFGRRQPPGCPACSQPHAPPNDWRHDDRWHDDDLGF